MRLTGLQECLRLMLKSKEPAKLVEVEQLRLFLLQLILLLRLLLLLKSADGAACIGPVTILTAQIAVPLEALPPLLLLWLLLPL